MPVTELHSNRRLGRATLIRTCCMAVAQSGDTTTLDGVPITDFRVEYDYTHEKAIAGIRDQPDVPEYVVADHPCVFGAEIVNQDAGSAIVQYEGGVHAAYSQNFVSRRSAGHTRRYRHRLQGHAVLRLVYPQAQADRSPQRSRRRAGGDGHDRAHGG